ncbi:YbfB/YjiJ family MFS transporter [Dankookia rubra]|nr:YbfB/YjiJ family MFS transporter [Dankookia rubra]
MLALASAMGIGRFVYTPILPAMIEALDLSKAEAGLIASANFVGYLAGALVAAAPRLPGSRRAWFLGALLLGAATTAAMGLVGSLWGFLLLRLIGGTASAFVLVLGSDLILDRLAAVGRGSLSALHFAGVGLGIAASAALVTALEAAGADWRGLWVAVGGAAAAVVPVVVWLVPAEAVAPARPVSVDAPVARRPSGLGRLALCHGLFGFGYVATATFLVAVVRASPEARALEPVVWLIVGLAALPSTAAWGWAGTRIGPRWAYAAACLLEALGVAAGGLWTTSAGALLTAALLGGTFMGITALGFAAARALAPDDQRRAFALTTAGFGVGQIAGPVMDGLLLDRTGGFAAPSLLAAAALLLAASLITRGEPRASMEG